MPTLPDRGQRGASFLEYILLAALVTAFCVVVVSFFQASPKPRDVDDQVESLGLSVDDYNRNDEVVRVSPQDPEDGCGVNLILSVKPTDDDKTELWTLGKEPYQLTTEEQARELISKLCKALE